MAPARAKILLRAAAGVWVHPSGKETDSSIITRAPFTLGQEGAGSCAICWAIGAKSMSSLLAGVLETNSWQRHAALPKCGLAEGLGSTPGFSGSSFFSIPHLSPEPDKPYQEGPFQVPGSRTHAEHCHVKEDRSRWVRMQAPGLWEVSLEARNADQVKDEQRGANSFLSRLVLANFEPGVSGQAQ